MYPLERPKNLMSSVLFKDLQGCDEGRIVTRTPHSETGHTG